MRQRPTNEHERAGLKAVTNRALRQVGAANFAPDTRVSEGQLSKYGSVSEDEKYMPLDVIADLERVIGDPMISAYLAGLSGFKVVPDEHGHRAPTMEDVSAVADSKGRLLSALITALIDGHVDHHEKRNLLPLVRDAIAQLQALEKGLLGAPA